MPRWLTIVLGLVVALAAAIGAAAWWYLTRESREPSMLAYAEHCAGCHGAALEGTDLGPALVDVPLRHGASAEALTASIAGGFPERGMPGWADALSPNLVKGLALYVSERRQHFPSTTESFALQMPNGLIEGRLHDFRIEPVLTLDSLGYSIAPLPDGRILVTEQIRGLSVVEADGIQGPLVTGTPEVFPPFLTAGGGYLALGTMLDVALHPAYAENGWIYLSYTERCHLDCGSLVPRSMVRVVRGRIRDGRWVDEETIWSTHPDNYTVVPDRVAAGRLAFDDAGHVYVTIGGKATYDWVQDLDRPTGKIHRVRDDGSVPEDNPFWLPPGERAEASSRHTVFTYGHRTTQGLAGHPRTGDLWATEMGPRGGDEVNRLVAGGNYGWPLYTNGLDYDGSQISIGTDLGLDFPFEDTVMPVIDYTPAPAISSFTFHEGTAFPGWNEDLLIGTLKARTLYRVRIEDGVRVDEEKLITGLGRIRDVEMGFDGRVYLLLEHGGVSSIARLAPVPG